MIINFNLYTMHNNPVPIDKAELNDRYNETLMTQT